MFILGKVYWTKYLDHLHNGGTKLINSLKHSRVQIKQIFEQIYSIKVIWRLSTPLDEGCRKRDIRLRSPPMLSHHSKSHEKWGRGGGGAIDFWLLEKIIISRKTKTTTSVTSFEYVNRKFVRKVTFLKC